MNMTSAPPFCSIIIPALNEERDIEACLSSLSQQTYPKERYEIIVVDNGSQDATKSLASKYADQVFERVNCNVGAVRNYGAEKAKGEILIWTDADCAVDENWIETGVSLLQENESTIFGGGLKPRKDPSWIERLWLLNDSGKNIQQKDLMGSCIFTTRELYLKSGKFPEDITSGEDTALSQSARSHSISVVLSPMLSLAHLGSPTTPLEFIRRQQWHGENYLKKPKDSLRDKTFLIALCYSASLLTAILSTLFGIWSLSLTSVVCSLILSALVSIKRILRANGTQLGLKDTLGVLVLDHFYLIGRGLGIAKGLAGRGHR